MSTVPEVSKALFFLDFLLRQASGSLSTLTLKGIASFLGACVARAVEPFSLDSLSSF